MNGTHVKIRLLENNHLVNYLRLSALGCIQSIYEDYFDNIDSKLFEALHLYHESVVMKAAAYRFATPEILCMLFERAVAAYGGAKCEFMIHPVFYLRVSKPKHLQHSTSSSPLLDSQPHYDRSYGCYAYSHWLAIEKANVDSGGLCFFDDSVINHFHVDWDKPNLYNYDRYVEDHKNIDKLICSSILHPDLEAGEAYRFDSNTLHAATQPKTATRISFDFRIAKTAVVNMLDIRSRELFKFFNSNVALSNARNLRLLGDNIGAERLISDYNLDLNLLNDIAPLTNITLPKNKLAWRTEYAWFHYNPKTL
jgi:hypothetical protein